MKLNNIELPPPISILLNESKPPVEDGLELKRWYRRLSAELRRQAEWTAYNFEYSSPAVKPSQFLAIPSGGLDPCNSSSVCMEHKCRINTAANFSKTLGLYAEHTILLDDITTTLLKWKSFDDERLMRFAGSVSVLHELRPLIEASIISFRSGAVVACRECRTKLEEEVEAIVTRMVGDFVSDIDYMRHEDGSIAVDVEPLAGYPMVTVLPLRYQERGMALKPGGLDIIAEDLFRSCARDVVRNMIISIRAASVSNGIVISPSSPGLHAVRTLDEGNIKLINRENWETGRSLELPWIKNLSAEQIVMLREMSGEALPRLRERFGDVLRGNQVPEQEIQERIRQLREECAEVKSDLRSLRSRHESIFRNVSGILGISLAIFGFSSDLAIPTVGSLMALLGLLHTSEHNEAMKKNEAVSKPGYVLLKAQEILDHAK